jgi:hypothetical protein
MVFVDIGKFTECASAMALFNLILPQHVGPVCLMFTELHTSPPSRQAATMQKGIARLECHVCTSLSSLLLCSQLASAGLEDLVVQ